MKQIFILLLACIMTGCLNRSDENGDIGQINGSGSGFPLTIGNYWIFSSDHPIVLNFRELWQVCNNTTVSGIPYTMIEKRRGEKPFDTLTIRQGSDGTVFRLENGQERTWLNPTVPNGGTYTYPGNSYTYQVTVKHDIKYKLSNDTVITCTRFEFDEPSMIDEEIFYLYAPGYGIVAVYYAWYALHLYTFHLQ